ncbi:MAG: hypothetical protein ACO4B4_00605 [Planctomycetota bacterium]|jgi:hypothetical protein
MTRTPLRPLTSRVRPFLLLGLLAAPLAAGLLLPPSTVLAQDGETDLSWRKDEGQALFDRGRSEFESGDFEAAYNTFREAKKLAKGTRTKGACDRWAYGAQGGHELSELKKRIADGKEAAVYSLANKNLPLYLETPIGDEYRKFVEELEKRLYVVLEDFEIVSPRYSEKFGKKFIDDPAKVKQGKRCLEWAVDNKGYSLKVSRLPGNFDQYAGGAITFWLCFEKGSGPYDLVFNVPGADRSNSGEKIDKAFIKQMKAHRGWKKITVPLKDFQAQGGAEWGLVQDFRIQFSGRQKFTCWIDSIMILK